MSNKAVLWLMAVLAVGMLGWAYYDGARAATAHNAAMGTNAGSDGR